MTKKLNETFGFEEEDYSDIEPEVVIPSSTDEMTVESGITEHEHEMNEIHKIALKAHKDTLESGLSIDPKMSAALLTASTKYLDIALAASKSKVDKKLSLLKIKNPVIPQQQQIANIEENGEVIEGGILCDRNKLLEDILEDTNTDKNLNTKN